MSPKSPSRSFVSKTLIDDPAILGRLVKENLPQPIPPAPAPGAAPELAAPFVEMWHALSLRGRIHPQNVKHLYPLVIEFHGFATPMTAAIIGALGKVSLPQADQDYALRLLRHIPFGTKWIGTADPERAVQYGYTWVVSEKSEILEHGWMHRLEEKWFYAMADPTVLRGGVVAFVMLAGPLKSEQAEN